MNPVKLGNRRLLKLDKTFWLLRLRWRQNSEAGSQVYSPVRQEQAGAFRGTAPPEAAHMVYLRPQKKDIDDPRS